MSRIKNVKLQSENNINIVDLLTLIIPTNKTKYVEILIRMMKSTSDLKEYHNHVIESLSSKYKIDENELKKFPKFQLAFIILFFEKMFIESDIEEFQKFCEFNERGLILENDLTKYNSFSKIKMEVSLAELKSDIKEMEGQVHKIHEDDEWIVLRPLTYHSSLKYGSNTKWCTASNGNYDYFKKYASNGILIYCINKKTALKVAFYKDIEVTCWNQKDDKIDSIDSGLPIEILKIIKDELDTNNRTNISFLSKNQIKKEESIYMKKFPNLGITDGPTQIQFTGDDETVTDEPITDDFPPIIEPLQNRLTTSPEPVTSTEIGMNYEQYFESLNSNIETL